jgi:hypothetical protein
MHVLVRISRTPQYLWKMPDFLRYILKLIIIIIIIIII